MDDDTEPETDGTISANDNQVSTDGRGEPGQKAQQQMDRVVLTIARLIGRPIAREQFAALSAANDNRPRDVQDAEDGADED